jgi:hypothetical protein
VVDPRYLRSGFDFALAHAVEEAGEFLAAAGKTQRWGVRSTNPELPPKDREENQVWLLREMADLRGALDRLEKHLAGGMPTSLGLIAHLESGLTLAKIRARIDWPGKWVDLSAALHAAGFTPVRSASRVYWTKTDRAG